MPQRPGGEPTYESAGEQIGEDSGKYAGSEVQGRAACPVRDAHVLVLSVSSQSFQGSVDIKRHGDRGPSIAVSCGCDAHPGLSGSVGIGSVPWG